ncbi:hypothetical protein E2C01_084126 [Portunus trituberculatus]|uniref:Uncharacterized protein n=1 Tax=Portunus trituberculatus TaxID=210409 RepID=A0A5B7IXF4_PORTR|nr:hypothetical protein [Portunus trituberculatus]
MWKFNLVGKNRLNYQKFRTRRFLPAPRNTLRSAHARRHPGSSRTPPATDPSCQHLASSVLGTELFCFFFH